jgi:2-polyprenyl-3-methyl-5-hydroxy-6-metoxy-1,4-benzoquinol methylase
MSARRDIEQAADWEGLWQGLDDDEGEVTAELAGLRWRVQRQLAEERFGSLEGLRVIEIGAGRSTNALLYAMHGARATVLDFSPTALERSRQRFEGRGLEVETVEADAFDLPNELRGRFDVSMSFGLCEHFLGERRQAIVGAHIELLRPGGLAIVNVPNRYSPFYRAWMGIAKRRGTWTLGTEVPFSARELTELARRGGGEPLPAIHVGGLGTLVNHGLNPVVTRLGAKPLPVPQVRVPGLDLLAYDLLLPVGRPA